MGLLGRIYASPTGRTTDGLAPARRAVRMRETSTPTRSGGKRAARLRDRHPPFVAEVVREFARQGASGVFNAAAARLGTSRPTEGCRAPGSDRNVVRNQRRIRRFWSDVI